MNKEIIKEISNLTDQNDHTGAILFLAKELGYKSFIDRANKISIEHENQGYLTMELNDKRYSLLKDLLEAVKVKFGQSVYKKVYMAF